MNKIFIPCFILIFLIVGLSYSKSINSFKNINASSQYNNTNVKDKDEVYEYMNINSHDVLGVSAVNNIGALITDGVYKVKNNGGTSNKNYPEIYEDFPVFNVGSYDQITNNIRYPNNPDDGECVRADMCNALYENRQPLVNANIQLLGEAETGYGARVNYYRTEPNILFYSIPTNINIPY